MAELHLVLDRARGQVLLEGPEHLPAALLADVEALLGPPREIACAAPPALLPPPAAAPDGDAGGAMLRVAGYYHDSLIEGPGRRSTVKLQGCPIRCAGCVTPDSWDPRGGALSPVEALADALLDPAHRRDGVSVVGGEPFAQAEGLLALVRALRRRGCLHLLVYSGYTYERLRRMAAARPAVDSLLGEIDVLIDGPFVAALAGGGGPWTGSANQRLIDAAATRRRGRVVLWRPDPDSRAPRT